MYHANNEKRKTTNDERNRKIRTLVKKGNLQILANIGSGHHQTSGDERKNKKNNPEERENYSKPNYIVEISSNHSAVSLGR